MGWSATAMKKLTASFLLACGLIGCSGDTKAPEEARHYDFSMENGTLEMKDGVRLAVTYYRPSAILNLSSRRSGHRLWPLCQARDHEFDQCGPAGKVAVGGERAHVLKQALAAGDELT